MHYFQGSWEHRPPPESRAPTCKRRDNGDGRHGNARYMNANKTEVDQLISLDDV